MNLNTCNYFSVVVIKHNDQGNLWKRQLIGGLQYQRSNPWSLWLAHGRRRAGMTLGWGTWELTSLSSSRRRAHTHTPPPPTSFSYSSTWVGTKYLNIRVQGSHSHSRYQGTLPPYMASCHLVTTIEDEEIITVFVLKLRENTLRFA